MSTTPASEGRLGIVLVSGIYPPDIGGPATHIADLEAELRQAGFDVLVLTLADVARLEEQDGVIRIPRSWPWPIRLGAVAWWLASNASRYDVVYATGLQPAAVAGARLGRRRVIVKIVGDPVWERGRREGLTAEDFDRFQATGGGFPRIRAMRTLRNWSLRSADEILTPSAFLASLVERWLGGPANVHVVPNGVRLPAWIPGRTSSDQGLRLAWVGRLVSHKRVERLVDAVAETTHTVLTVVGDGPEREQIEDLVSRRNVNDRVHLTGSLDHDAALAVVADADALVLASDYEGLPHVAIEALALGTPIISPAVGGTAEVLRDGETGLLVTDSSVAGFQKAFARLRDDASLRSELHEGARAEGALWTFARTANQIQKLIIDGQGRPRIVFLGKTLLRSLTPDLEARLEIIARGVDPRLVNVGGVSVRRLGRTVAYVLPAFHPPAASGALFYLLAPVVAIVLAARRRPSAVVCQSPYEGAGAVAWARLVPRALRPAVVVEVHGDWRTASRLYGSPARRAVVPFADRVAAWAIRGADRVRVVGSYTENLVRDAGFTGPVDRFIAFNDLTRFLDPIRKLPAHPTAVFVGVLEPYKGLDVLLEAWVDVLRRVPGAKLRVVGEGTHAQALTKLTNRLEIQGSVEFLGRIPREEMPSTMDAASLLVLPSRSEGLGLVVLEAMARGRAVVASDVGGIVELVRDGATGYLVPPGDAAQLSEAVIRLLEDRRLSTSLGRAGRRVVEDMDASLGFEAGMNRLRSWVLDR